MKKVKYLLALSIFVLTVSGCSDEDRTEKDPDKIPNPVEDPGGYVPGMVDLNKKMQSDIQSATDKENGKLQKALDENNPEN